MPPQALYVATLQVRTDPKDICGSHEPEVYSSKEAANEAAERLVWRLGKAKTADHPDWRVKDAVDEEGLYRGSLFLGSNAKTGYAVAAVWEVRLDKMGDRGTDVKASLAGAAPAAAIKKEADDDVGDEEDDVEADDDDEEEEEDEKPAKSKSKTKSKSKDNPSGRTSTTSAKLNVQRTGQRKTIPKGQPNCLEGVKILFTGTFETMDRVTSIATAKKYGADVVKKLEDTDYIVLGFRPGPAKLKIINELELETITEQEFFDILEDGLSEDKKMRMENKRKADEEEEPESPAPKKRKR